MTNRKRTRPQRPESRALELGAPVVVSARYPQELLAAIDSARGAVPRQRWLIEAARVRVQQGPEPLEQRNEAAAETVPVLRWSIDDLGRRCTGRIDGNHRVVLEARDGGWLAKVNGIEVDHGGDSISPYNTIDFRREAEGSIAALSVRFHVDGDEKNGGAK